MKLHAILTALMLAAAFANAQEDPALEDLKAEREALRQRLEQTEEQIQGLEGPPPASGQRELKEWEAELQKEMDTINQYLVELPQDLSKYFVTMQGVLGELLKTIDESWTDTSGAARAGISEAERKYREARGRAFDENRMYDLQARALALNAEQETAESIRALQAALAEVDKARASLSTAERDLELREQQAEIAARKVELQLLDIETRRMEESLQKSR